MRLNKSEENSDYLSKLQEQNGEEYEDVAEEVEDSGKRKSKQTKKSIQGKQKMRKAEEIEKDGNDKKDWNDNEMMDFMSATIFDFPSNEIMNVACWIKHVE